MAGLKHRYVIVQTETQQRRSLASTLKGTIVAGIKDRFGDLALSKIDCLEISEYYENLGIAIVRCNIDAYKYMCHTIMMLGKKDRAGVRLRIVSVSGILKKAKRELMKTIKARECESNGAEPIQK